MVLDDTSTLTVGPLDSLSGSTGGLPLVPALTIAWHPDLTRVGHVAPLTALLDSDTARLTRYEPLFFPAGSSNGHPIDHRAFSRTEPSLLVVATGKTFELLRGTNRKSAIELDGAAFDGRCRLTAQDLNRGLILTVANQIVLCLHGIHFPVTRSPTLGLVGVSDAIEDVRRMITRIADLPASVLIRGETGTGKELVAKAIHESSPRRRRNFVAVNMGNVRPERATADLFGYERGAFTGATAGQLGYFRSAQGGTLFLDEIGLTALDVQPMLLRVIEDRKVQPLGSTEAREVDVRLIAATDARLEEAVTAGRFEPSLYHRLNSALPIALPPLRERREDIGLLFATFLRETLAATGALHRLDVPSGKAGHLISAPAVAELCQADWSGNVRALLALAQKLVVESDGVHRFNPLKYVASYLKTQLPVAGGAPRQPDARPALAGASPRELSVAAIVDALEQTGWNQAQSAKVLGIASSTLFRRLSKEPAIQLLTRTKLADLLQKKEACGGDLRALAQQLRVPEDLLARRLRSSA